MFRIPLYMKPDALADYLRADKQAERLADLETLAASLAREDARLALNDRAAVCAAESKRHIRALKAEVYRIERETTIYINDCARANSARAARTLPVDLAQAQAAQAPELASLIEGLVRMGKLTREQATALLLGGADLDTVLQCAGLKPA